MNVVRFPHATKAPRDKAGENEDILRDLEKIIRETLPPERAEAYVESLRRLLRELGHDVPRTLDDHSERSGRHS